MSVLSELDISNGLEYFGINDMSTNWDLNLLFDKKNAIINYYQRLIENITYNLETYIDFLFLTKLLKLEELYMYISDDYKQEFNEIIAKLKEINTELKVSKILCFVRDNFNEIINYDDKRLYYDLIKITIDICFKYYSAMNDQIFNKIEKDYWYIVLDHFDEYIEFYKKFPERFKNLINDEVIEEKWNDYDRLFVLLSKYRVYPFGQDLINAAEKITKIGLTLLNEIDEDNYILQITNIEKIHKIAVYYQLEDAYIFNENKSRLDEIGNKYLNKHGIKEPFPEIDFKSIIKHFKESTLPNNILFLELTHSPKNNKFISNFNIIGENNDKSLSDYVTMIGTETDNYFTNSKIQRLKYTTHFNIDLLLRIFQDQILIDKLLSGQLGILNYFQEKILKQKKNLLEEFEGITNIVLLILSLEINNNTYKGLCYSSIMHICSFIEKLLRIEFIHVQTKQLYFSEEYINLGDLLRSTELINIYGKHHIKILEYFLVKNQNNIGKNIRNNFTHNRNVNFNEINLYDTLRVYYLLITVINGLFSNYCKIT